MSQYQDNDIEALSERLGSLQIMNKALKSTNKQMDIEMSSLVAMQGNNKQARVSKIMVPDSEQFDRDRIKFKDWWRGIRLFLKNNRVMETDDRIIVILTHLKESIASIYAQKKLN